MVMRALREGAFAGFLKYVLFGFLGLSVLGLVFMDVGSSFRNNVAGNRDIAIVDGRPLSLMDFDSSLRQTIDPMGISTAQAFQLGFTEQILTQEIRNMFVAIEAEKLGVALSDSQIKKTIAEIVKPVMREGQTMQDALNDALSNRRMTEKQFVHGVKKELTRNVIMNAVQNGFTGMNPALIDDLMAFQNQTRDVEIIVFPDSDIKDVKAPTEEQLQKLYEAYKTSQFKIPEYRVFKFALFDKAKIEATSLDATDEEIQEFYDSNIKNFSISEQKKLTQFLSPSKEEAEKIMAQVNEGKGLEDAVAAVKGGDGKKQVTPLILAVDMMFPQMKSALDAIKVGNVAGPIQTPLGYHVLRLDGAIPPTTKSLDEVKNALKTEIIEQKKGKQLYDLSVALEDHFGNGGQIADANDIVAMIAIDVPAFESTGLGKDGKDAFEKLDQAYKDDKENILKSAFEIAQDDVEKARVIELQNGNYAAIELVTLEPESYKSYDSAKSDIQKQFEDDQRAADNTTRIEGYLKALNEGKISFQDLATKNGKSLKKIIGVTVSGPIEPPLDEAIRPSLFKNAIGSYLEFQPEGPASAIIYIKAYKLNPMKEEQKKGFPVLQSKMEEEIKQEAALMYIDALGKKYEARINEDLMKRAYGQNAADAP